MSELQFELLQMIDTAFQGVELGDGVSLHETVVIDDFGGTEQRRAARAADEKYDWRRLVRDPELIRPVVGGISGGGLCFYDAAGLRFHLPAYLSRGVIEPEVDEHAGHFVSDLLTYLTHAQFSENRQVRCALLNAAQRACVGEVLNYFRDMYDFPENEPLLSEIDDAIEGYWNASA